MQVHCPHCRAPVKVRPAGRTRRYACPACRGRFDVPPGMPAPAPEPPTPQASAATAGGLNPTLAVILAVVLALLLVVVCCGLPTLGLLKDTQPITPTRTPTEP
jgi:hypothetical protein